MWTHAVQICVVQESTVQCYQLQSPCFTPCLHMVYTCFSVNLFISQLKVCSLLPTSPYFPQPADSDNHLCNLCFYEIPHISDAVQQLPFCDQLASLNIMPSRSIHVVANGRISFFLMPKSYYKFILCIIYIYYVCSVMSYSLKSIGLQRSRLICPWDFSGKNTREGCHFRKICPYV